MAKWISVIEHIQDIHEGFDGLFPRCAHDRLEGREREKPWIVPCRIFFMHVKAISIVCS